jgi:hypothetical protein
MGIRMLILICTVVGLTVWLGIGACVLNVLPRKQEHELEEWLESKFLVTAVLLFCLWPVLLWVWWRKGRTRGVAMNRIREWWINRRIGKLQRLLERKIAHRESLIDEKWQTANRAELGWLKPYNDEIANLQRRVAKHQADLKGGATPSGVRARLATFL